VRSLIASYSSFLSLIFVSILYYNAQVSMRPYERMSKSDLVGVIKALEVKLSTVCESEEPRLSFLVRDLQNQVVHLKVENLELKKSQNQSQRWS